MFKVSSRQSLLESGKYASLFKEADEYNRNDLKNEILTHPDVRKRLDIFALSIYSFVVFPKILGHVDEAVAGLFDRLDKKVTPIPGIFSETFRSLSACRKTGEGG
ncbi:hypothetical protein Goklo_029544 [Gossypium klotzschianum]|uniref:Uncharacterized protein n=1 Tax=Gossypium klotzschianum TaxID=34286 RepID=A0A7J8W4E7_9ROSI|nr:hypothetical protein [Gossypium klotzschianum]